MRFARATLGVAETDEFGSFRRVFGNDHSNTVIGRVYHFPEDASTEEIEGPGEFFGSTQWDGEPFDTETAALDYVLRTYNAQYRGTTRTDEQFRTTVAEL